MRLGKQLTLEQSESLVKSISDEEIYKVVLVISDLKAPSFDGFGAKFFKSSWRTVKGDVIAIVREYFE